MTTSVATTLSTDRVLMDAGQERESEILIRNEGDEFDSYTVEVLGPAAAWTTVTPSVVSVSPGGRELVRVVYAPPRGAGARIGNNHVAFRITSYRDPNRTTTEEAVVEIAPFAALDVRLEPTSRTTTRRARYTLLVSNNGNSTVRCQANTYSVDEGDQLDVTLGGAEFVSEPATTTQIPVRAQAQKRFIRGQALTLPFVVELNGDLLDRPVQTEGVLNQIPLLGSTRLRLTLALIALLALLGVGWAILASWSDPVDTTDAASQGKPPVASASPAPPAAAAPTSEAPQQNGALPPGTQDGSAGAPGLPGSSGTPGLAGGKGDAGTAGNPGLAGGKGDAGTAGATGGVGQPGTPGNTGGIGKTGDTGGIGKTGDTGATGQTGATGSAGADGIAPPTVLSFGPTTEEPTTQTLQMVHYLASGKTALYYLTSPSGDMEIDGVTLADQFGGNSTLNLEQPGPGQAKDEVTASSAASPTTSASPTAPSTPPSTVSKVTDWSGILPITRSSPALVQLTCTPDAGSAGCGAAVTFTVRKPVAMTQVLNSDTDLPTDRPAAKIFTLVHHIPRDTSTTGRTHYEFSTAADTDVTGIAVASGVGGASTVQIGPGLPKDANGQDQARPIVSAGPGWTGSVAATKRQPLAVDMGCTPVTTATIGGTTCVAKVTITYRKPAPQPLGLSAPSETPQTQVFDLTRAASADSPAPYQFVASADTDITGIALADSVGHGSTATVGAGNATVGVTSADRGAYSGQLNVPKGTPLPITLTCSNADATAGCSAKLTVTFAVARINRTVDGPITTPDTSDFGPPVKLDAPGGAPGYYWLMTQGDTQITQVTVAGAGKATLGLGDVNTDQASTAFVPGTSPANEILLPNRPLPIRFECPSAAPCGATLTMQGRRPVLPEETLTGADPAAAQTHRLVHSPDQGTAARYSFRPSEALMISDLTVTNPAGTGVKIKVGTQGANRTPTLVTPTDPTAATTPSAAASSWAAGNIVTTPETPLIVELSCTPATNEPDCGADVNWNSRSFPAPAVEEMRLKPVSLPDNPTGLAEYYPVLKAPGSSSWYKILPPVGGPQVPLTSLAFSSPGAVCSAAFASSDGQPHTPITVADGDVPWRGRLNPTEQSPILLEVRCTNVPSNAQAAKVSLTTVG